MESSKLSQNNLIEVVQASKKYQKIQALSNLSIQIRSGEIFGLIGPDGAGKSTLTHIIAGIVRPNKGSVTVLGKNVLRDPESIKGLIGFLPQGLGLSLAQELTIDENINYFSQINQVSQDKREARKAVLLQKTGLTDFKNRPAKYLSGGMQQKLALCCTLIHEPKLLLLDEPTTGVDPISRRDIWLLLNSMVQETGVTILLTTSYMDEAARCHRVALMHNGEMIETGEPSDLLAKAGAIGMDELFLAHIPKSKDESLNKKAFQDFFQKRSASDQNSKQAVIKADKLEKKYHNFIAVNKISFEIKQGEIFGFLGPNGAGKTTTIKMLCGLVQPTSGAGTIAGFNLSRQAAEIKKHIGYMSQRFSLYGSLTVAENIELYGSIYELSRREVLKRRDLLYLITDLVGKEKAVTKDLPLGIKQRLALGCAIIHKPTIVFLDEPTSGVDPLARKKFWETILLLSRQMGVTILVSTHHLDEAQYCDRIILMDQGNIVATGNAQELRQNVQNEMGALLEISTNNLSGSYQVLKQHFLYSSIYGAHVHVFTKDPVNDKSKIKNLLAEKAIELKCLKEQMIPFENVFTYFCETKKDLT